MTDVAPGSDGRPGALEGERPGGCFLFAEHLLITLSALDILDDVFEATRIDELPVVDVLDRLSPRSVTVNIHGEPYRLRQHRKASLAS